jgi:hypothetical protein
MGNVVYSKTPAQTAGGYGAKYDIFHEDKNVAIAGGGISAKAFRTFFKSIKQSLYYVF